MAKRKTTINDFLMAKLTRLEKFYRYGLSQAGWNKYHYISLEFDNQIICKKNVKEIMPKPVPAPVSEQPATSEPAQTATQEPSGQPQQQQNNKQKTV